MTQGVRHAFGAKRYAAAARTPDGPCSRIVQAGSPCLFGLAIQKWALGAFWISSGAACGLVARLDGGGFQKAGNPAR